MLPLDVLSIRAFRNLWLGQAISQLGDSLYYVVFMFMVQKVTGSYAMVGYVGALETVPYFLFSAYAGVVADRIDRKKIMMFSDIFCGVLLSAFALFVVINPTPHFAVIGGVAFLLSSVRVFFFPAKNASIPRLVPAESLMRANALSSMTFNLAYIVGLSFSASILAGYYLFSPKGFFVAAFSLNAISFFISAMFIAKLPRIQPERSDAPQHPLADVKEGVRYIGRRHELIVLLTLQLLLTLFVSPFFPVYVASNEQWFGGKPATLLWFEFAFFGGFTVGSIFVGRLNLTRPGLGFITGIALTGATVAAMAFSPNFWLFCLWNFGAGIFLPFASIPVMTFLQISVDDAFRGRVNSALNMTQMGMQPLGLTLSGLLLQKMGIVVMFLVMGIGMAGAALLGLLDRPFRMLRMPATKFPVSDSDPESVAEDIEGVAPSEPASVKPA